MTPAPDATAPGGSPAPASRDPLATLRRGWGALPPSAVAVVAVVITPVVVFADRLLAGRVIAPADARYIIIPLRQITAWAWREGRLPAWNPYSFSGSPVMAFGQGGALYPPQLLFVVLGPALGTNVLLVGHLALAGVGAFVLARRLTGDVAAALLAGLAFPLSGFFMGHIAHHNMVAAAAWLPWMIVGFLWLADRLSPVRVLVAALPVALAALASHPQAFAIDLVALGLFAGGWLVTAGPGSRLRVAVAAAAPVVVGAALAAPQLLVTAAALADSSRAEVGAATAFAFSFSFDPSHLPLLLFPHLFGATASSGPYAAPYRGLWHLAELNGYPGLVLLAVAAVGILHARRHRAVPILAGMAGASLLLALAGTTPLGPLVAALPVLGSFRAWARYVVILDLAVALLAAVGLSELRRLPAPARRRWAVAAAIPVAGAAIVGALAVAVPAVHRLVAPGWTAVAAAGFPLLFGLGAVLALALPRRQDVMVAAVCGLAVVDLVVSFGGFAEWRPLSPTSAQIAADLDPDRRAAFGPVFDAPGGIDRFLYVSPYVAGLSDFSFVTDAKRLRSASGQDVLAPRWYLSAFPMNHFGVLANADAVLAEGNDLLDVLRVTTVIAEADRRAPQLVGPGDPIGTTGLVVHHRQPRLDDAYLVADVRPGSRADAVAALRGALGVDLATTAVVEGECGSCPPGPGRRPGAVVGRSWRDDAVDITLDTDAPGLLVVSQAWSPGWRATVDGRPAPVLRTNALVQGIPVPAGARRVRLRYHPPGLVAGAVLAVATLSALLVLAGVPVLSRRLGKMRR